MADWIHFMTPAGHVIGMTLPLHESIEQQWQNGDLQQVSEDGSSWGEPDVEGAAQQSHAEGDMPEAPARPKAAANKTEWQDYAVALGACTAEDAAGMTKAQLVELATPRELLPPDPEV
jgi:hypothetical protein